jgi:hypothetical protein
MHNSGIYYVIMCLWSDQNVKDGLEGACIEHGRRFMHTGDRRLILKGYNMDALEYRYDII